MEGQIPGPPPGGPPPGAQAPLDPMTVMNNQLLDLNNRLVAQERQMAEQQVLLAQRTAELQELRAQPPSSTGSHLDYKGLGKPDHFNGDKSKWKEWATVFRAFIMAMEPLLAELLAIAEGRMEPILNVVLTQPQIAASTKLYFFLVMICRESALVLVTNAGDGQGVAAWQELCKEYDPQIPAKHSGDLLALLNWDFSGDFSVAYASFRKSIRTYTEQSGELFSDNIAIGTIVRQIPAGPLKTHLLLNIGKLKTIKQFEDEMMNVQKAIEVANAGPMPMDIGQMDGGSLDALGKGGKGAGKGKTRGQNVKDLKCWYCEKQGHTKSECRKLIADKKAGTVKPSGGGGGGPPQTPRGGGGGGGGQTPRKAFSGKCNKCGKQGHKARDCKSLLALEDAPEGATGDVTGLFLNVLEAFQLCASDVQLVNEKAQAAHVAALDALDELAEEIVEFSVDSGAVVTIVPKKTAIDYPLLDNAESLKGRSYRSANGQEVRDHGTRALVGTFGGSSTLKGLKARVGDVVRALASVYELVQAGNKVVFDDEASGGSYCLNKRTGERIPFTVKNRAYVLNMKVKPHSALPREAKLTKLDLNPLHAGEPGK